MLIYIEALASKGKRLRINVSGILRILDVSRTGYYSFKNRYENIKNAC